LGRIMNFETWTNTVGLLAHTGFGLGFLENSKCAIQSKDRMVNFMAGVTVKLNYLKDCFNSWFNNPNAAIDPLPPHFVVVSGVQRGFNGEIYNGTVVNSLLR
jgi:OOP family OmpA-OmpF porin